MCESLAQYFKLLNFTAESLGLEQQFVDNGEIQHNLKAFACLSLIPETFVVEEFERIQEEPSDEINGMQFYGYN